MERRKLIALVAATAAILVAGHVRGEDSIYEEPEFDIDAAKLNYGTQNSPIFLLM